MKKVANKGVDVNALASWMGRDEIWLAHVIEHNFGCGCGFDYEDILACEIWKALEALQRAQDELEKAQAKHEAAQTAANAMTVGGQQ